jgi:hypothetical protein
MVFYNQRYLVWLLGVAILLAGCGKKTVINFLVRDDLTKYPISDARISILDDKGGSVISGENGKASMKRKKNELPRDYILPYGAERDGYNPKTGYFVLLPPLKPVYVIPLQRKAPNVTLDLQAEPGEPGKEIQCSAEIKNIGTADLTEAQLDLEIPKGITFKGWYRGSIRAYNSRLPLETIKPNDTKNYSFFVEASVPGTFELTAILKSKEIPEISKKLPIEVKPLLPELSLDLEEDKPKQIIRIVIKNKGRGEATAIEASISACCYNGNKDIELDTKLFKNIPPGKEEIIKYLIEKIIEKVRDKGVQGEDVEITASVSCNQRRISEKFKIKIPKDHIPPTPIEGTVAY